MAKKMLIDATHTEETRVVVVDGNKVEEFDFESENKRQLAGNIYLAKVTRVEPSLQAAFVDYGGNRHGFLAFSEIHPDYYQIPVADREALMEEERAYAEAMKARDEADEAKPKKRRSRSRTKAADVKSDDAVESIEVSSEPTGMETIDLDESEEGADVAVPEGTSPADHVAETPVEEPVDEGETTEPQVEAEAVVDAEAEAGAEDAIATSEVEAEASENTDETPAETAEEEQDVEAEPAPESAADESEDTVSEVEAPAEEGEAAEEASSEDDEKSEVEARADATSKDDSIESVADEDDSEDIRPVRKPRPRRYKIQEVIKVRQVLLVQVVKEERGNKGAALTTYLSLAGRYCVLMPNTARGGGISRKITNAPDRKKLKEIAAEIDVPTGAGLIIRTAGAKRTKSEIKRDYEYLQRMWEQIRELTLKSIAPAKIYEEGDLIKRSIRDLYNREIDEVLVEGEGGYRIAKDFMKMIMPSHAKNVKRYEDALPLFARYQVESYLAGMFNPTVQLKSGGYIVIGVTEALVAIDVNSGRATKEGSIEETALKTNLEAAEEVARQLRLRDLAGLIVIDFIDMDERKNNSAVEKRLKEKLKTDRARIQVGRISGFGLLEMSRQRLRPGMLEATTQPCPACHGTGLIRSDDNMALTILRQIEEEGTRRRSREVLVRCPVSIANFLMNQKREHIAQIEARYGLSVRVEGDVHLVSPDFSMEKFKTASRFVPEASAPVVSVDASLMDLVDANEEEQVEEESVQAEEETKPKRKRRRRRRKKSNGSGDTPEVNAEEGEAVAAEASEEAKTVTTEEAEPEGDAVETAEEEKAAKPKRRRAPRRKKKDAEPVESEGETPAEATPEEAATDEATVAVEETVVVEVAAEPVDVAVTEEAPLEVVDETAAEVEQVEATAELPEPEADNTAEAEPAQEEQPEPVAAVSADESQEPAEIAAEEVSEPVLEVVAEEPEQPAKPKRRGWWSLGQ
ncbi:ribonuclease E/G [Ruegeria sp. Ofav3-42]|uniref:Rne/Rng family ribonuclease n=1 Tax=Ruegeria sp. Ofav3-42 TaxID=2917759 RepID=UPI001EF46CA0|nr:ribonuclease E/G [Ruegeria sp. Ofav3-42]MCG7518392.1 Rne/Rng family ribonuclease [Ruegeria sp. Ofav3-42]